jgi:hypothetical protein
MRGSLQARELLIPIACCRRSRKGAGPVIAFRQVFCPIGFSDTSIRARTYAAAVGTWPGVQLTVLHILQRAAASDADLIVMGAHGNSGIEVMAYGSNTHHVVRAASCPVLTVRA